MENFLQLVEHMPKENCTLDQIHALAQTAKLDEFDYQNHVPPLDPKLAYVRNICCMEPLEVAILHWGPEAESAIHHHSGFYGCVLVLQGTCDDVIYRYEKQKLTETKAKRATKGGILIEYDNTIHKLCNPSKTENLITLHLYYPPLKNLAAMQIFHPDGRLATLSDKAQAAAFNEGPASYESFQENAFTYQAYADAHSASHRLFPLLPKPSPTAIQKMISAYYSEQAEIYDQQDKKNTRRITYIDKMNQKIAQDLAATPKVEKLLAVACGTGRRVCNIKEASGLDYQIVGVDANEQMCKKAEQRGLHMRQYQIADAPLEENSFDAATFLYAFGHLPNEQQRIAALQKIHFALKPGAALYFDLFNLHDQFEWGPQILVNHQKLRLPEAGYQLGDSFYKRATGENLSFLHYFLKEEIEALLALVGFTCAFIKYLGYRQNCGEEVGPNEGSFFIKAIKKNKPQ